MGVGLGGGLAPNSHLNIHKYHRYNKSDQLNINIKKFQRPSSNQYQQRQRQKYQHNINNVPDPDIDHSSRQRHGSFDESLSDKLKRGSDAGAASSFDHNYQYQHHTNYTSSFTSYISFRKRASSSESVKSNPPSSNPIKIPGPNTRKYSKDDSYTTYYDYSMAGISNKRNKRRGTMSRGSRNNSPRMTQNLFDLSNINDFVATNDVKSVVTTSFTSAHDINFKIYDNHF